MQKDEFKKGFLEQKIFNEMKDKPLGNAERFKKKFKDTDLDLTALYIKIINYQVKTYGSSIDRFVYIPNQEEKERRRLNAKNRKRSRLNRVK